MADLVAALGVAVATGVSASIDIPLAIPIRATFGAGGAHGLRTTTINPSNISSEPRMPDS